MTVATEQRLRPRTPAVGEGDDGEVFEEELPLDQAITYRVSTYHLNPVTNPKKTRSPSDEKVRARQDSNLPFRTHCKCEVP